MHSAGFNATDIILLRVLYTYNCATEGKNERAKAIVVRAADYFAVSTGRRPISTLPSFIHSSFTSFCRSA